MKKSEMKGFKTLSKNELKSMYAGDKNPQCVISCCDPKLPPCGFVNCNGIQCPGGPVVPK
ncbi:hypothetical protein [Chryseobacterium sp. Leaf201]|uniref:hypothetical protein n=1 Tax=Chryseobacterium sp. Leaf201 TaxID=1735672 RepID=UPI0006F471E7|nr:hypothetical protein [Chryseobacterium sp. Leaf201]KQM51709.1 hypothetical protein ASE55_08165 [Chryseobacterium sp. Leaf201]